MNVKFGEVGRIVAGRDNGWYVKIVDDRQSSGGFFILIAQSPSMQNGHDNWVEDEKMLANFFKESDWSIEWCD